MARIACPPARIELDIDAISPAQLPQPLPKCRESGLPFTIVRIRMHQHADAPHWPRLLRAHRHRPCRHRAAEHRDELAPPDHSITSSARKRTDGEMVRSRDFAVLRFTTNSSFEGCSTGRSAGLAPLRTLDTMIADCLHIAARLGP